MGGGVASTKFEPCWGVDRPVPESVKNLVLDIISDKTSNAIGSSRRASEQPWHVNRRSVRGSQISTIATAAMAALNERVREQHLQNQFKILEEESDAGSSDRHARDKGAQNRNSSLRNQLNHGNVKAKPKTAISAFGRTNAPISTQKRLEKSTKPVSRQDSIASMQEMNRPQTTPIHSRDDNSHNPDTQSAQSLFLTHIGERSAQNQLYLPYSRSSWISSPPPALCGSSWLIPSLAEMSTPGKRNTRPSKFKILSKHIQVFFYLLSFIVFFSFSLFGALFVCLFWIGLVCYLHFDFI